MIGVAITVLCEAGIKYDFCEPEKPRREVMGAKAFKELRAIKDKNKGQQVKMRKQYIVDWVKAKYPQFDGDDNAADAVMIALYALKESRS
jgi:hypothetical protein